MCKVEHAVEKAFDRLREMAEQTLSHVCKDLKVPKSRHAKYLAMVYNILVMCENNQVKVESATTNSQNRYVTTIVKRNRQLTSAQITREFATATWTQLSKYIVSYRMHQRGLYGRKCNVFQKFSLWNEPGCSCTKSSWLLYQGLELSCFQSWASFLSREWVYTRERLTPYLLHSGERKYHSVRQKKIRERHRYKGDGIMVIGRHHFEWPHRPTSFYECKSNVEYRIRTIMYFILM